MNNKGQMAVVNLTMLMYQRPNFGNNNLNG